MAPAVVNNQPNRLIPPKAANDAGSRNIPDPIMVPATSAVVISKFNFLGLPVDSSIFLFLPSCQLNECPIKI